MRRKPSSVPRLCSPWSAQLATTNAGTLMASRSAALLAQKSSNQGWAAVSAARSSISVVLAPQRSQM